jgi:hypothetical protein
VANYNEQVILAWEEYENESGRLANSTDDFLTWALDNGKLAPQPEDIRTGLKRRITAALRQKHRIDEDGVVYRAKQCVIDTEATPPVPLWFDTDTGGTPNLRKKAVRQRRDGIANDVYRAMCDVDHMNKRHSEHIQFVMDFSEDYLERKAAEASAEEILDVG